MLLLCNNFVFVFIISIAFFFKQIETVFFVFSNTDVVKIEIEIIPLFNRRFSILLRHYKGIPLDFPGVISVTH